MTRWLRRIALTFVIILAVIQVFPAERTNPSTDPVRTLHAQVPASTAASAVIDRSCRDCHSHQTTWPWYSRVAPVSWMVAHDVTEGRRAVNFSDWASYSVDRQRKLLREACEAVSEGEMPMWAYTLIHRDARLEAQDVSAICGLTRRDETVAPGS